MLQSTRFTPIITAKAQANFLAPIALIKTFLSGMTERFHTQGHRLGYPASLFCPVEVPAMAALWLATADEAKLYNGQHFMAQEFVRERGLAPEWESILPMNGRWSPTAILDWREPAKR